MSGSKGIAHVLVEFQYGSFPNDFVNNERTLCYTRNHEFSTFCPCVRPQQCIPLV